MLIMILFSAIQLPFVVFYLFGIVLNTKFTQNIRISILKSTQLTRLEMKKNVRFRNKRHRKFAIKF
jgi:hypothetical protein